ncbi:MAG: hypothetical protein Q9224_006488, partial [Gallowayella concinna]
MFLTCCKGYQVLSNTKKAPSDAQDAARQVRIEESVFAAWGEHWEIRTDLPEQQAHEKLKFHLVKSQTQNAVFDLLCAISDTFTDLKRLKKYGLVFEYAGKGKGNHLPLRDLGDLLEGKDNRPLPAFEAVVQGAEEAKRTLGRCKAKMSLLERCRWSIQDKTRIEDLVTKLGKHNDNLYRLCHWEALAQINRAIPALALLQTENFIDLHMVAKIAEKSAQDKTSPVAEGRERIAAIAKFKAKVMTPSTVSNKYQASWKLLDQRDYKVLSSSHPWSLGTSRMGQDPVFVEWKSYTDDDNRPNEVAENQIHQLGTFLSVANRPSDLRGLQCVGMFRDSANDRYGMVFELPKHLRDLAQHSRPPNLRIYNPSTLTDMIQKVDGIADLGARFNLARKLLQCVVMLHTSGWLHKNLHPENILFFAARPSAGAKITVGKKDLERPIIVGYDRSRPDDVQEPGRKEQQPVTQVARALHTNNIMKARKEPNYAIYQHPEKIAKPNRRFRHSYDIYSLGLMLLEIGLWQDLQRVNTSIYHNAE